MLMLDGKHKLQRKVSFLSTLFIGKRMGREGVWRSRGREGRCVDILRDDVTARMTEVQ